MHRLLERQLRRLYGRDYHPDESLEGLLVMIDSYYHEADKERRLLQNALSQSTGELNAVNERLRAQNTEMTRTLLNTLSDGVYATDIQGKLTFMNEAAERALGWREDELLGSQLDEYIQSKHLGGAPWPVETTPQMEVIFRNEAIDGNGNFIERSGKFMPVAYRARPILQDGQVIGALVSFQDVSTLKKAESDLHSAHNNLSSTATELNFQKYALDQHAIVSITDKAGIITYANNKLCQISGFTEKELLGQSHSILNSGYHDQVFFREMWQTILSGKIWRGEICNRSKGGNTYWVDSTIVPFMDEQGKPQRFVSIRTDITSQKLMELRLEKQRAFYEHVTETLGEGLYVQDIDGRCVYMNSEAERLLGWPRAEFIGKLVHDTIHKFTPEGRPLTEHDCPIMQDINDDGISRRDDQVFVNRDGNTFPIEISSQIIMHEGESEGVVVAFRDITQRKQHEALLKQAKARLDLSLEGSNLALFDWDVLNGMVYLSDRWSLMLGRERKEMLISSEQLANMVRSEQRDMVRKELENVFKGKAEFYSVEFQIQRDDGSWLWIHTHGKVVERNEEGRVIRMTGTNADITERKRAEVSMLQAKEEAVQASRVKSEFLANMSHEIRTPMNGIIGMTDLVLDTELNREQREFLTMVKLAADSLMVILNDILDLSKIESGKLEIEHTDFSLEHVLSATMKMMAESADHKKLEILLHISPDVPDNLIGDPMRLRQIIVNLVGNAIKFTEKGEIEVSVKTISALSENQVNLKFSVRDTGIGIPQDKLQSIFDSFSQADTSTTRKFGGTGLGLSISSQLIALMGGRVEVESKVGVGSTFTFTILMGVVSDPAIEKRPLSDNIAGLKVLVVDDNATNRALLLEMLANWKMSPVAVESGALALKELERSAQDGNPYKIVLLDRQMPNMDGFELAERILQHPELTQATVMMLTSEGGRGDGVRCRELGLAGYLVKPITQSELLDIIMVAIGDRYQQPPKLVTPHILREASQTLNLLLAEDNAVNQLLAVRMLEKFGHKVTLANNGIEAIELWENRDFDVILMDVDMPEMSGYEATARIREQEKTTGKHILIMAITAHAMSGAREECLRQGMDGYLSKPINMEELEKELGALSNKMKNIKSVFLPSQTAKVVDFDKVKELMDGSQELFDEIVKIFLDSSPIHIQRIKDGIAQGNSEQVRNNAHALKGTIGIFAADQAMLAVERVEKTAGELECKEALTKLEEALVELKAAVNAHQW